jgi:hypothetical protein
LPDALPDALWIPVEASETLTICCVSPDASMLAVAGPANHVRLFQCHVVAGPCNRETQPVRGEADAAHLWRARAQQRRTPPSEKCKHAWHYEGPDGHSLSVNVLANLTAPAFVSIGALAIGPHGEHLVGTTTTNSVLLWDLSSSMLARYTQDRALPMLVRCWVRTLSSLGQRCDRNPICCGHAGHIAGRRMHRLCIRTSWRNFCSRSLSDGGCSHTHWQTFQVWRVRAICEFNSSQKQDHEKRCRILAFPHLHHGPGRSAHPLAFAKPGLSAMFDRRRLLKCAAS